MRKYVLYLILFLFAINLLNGSYFEDHDNQKPASLKFTFRPGVLFLLEDENVNTAGEGYYDDNYEASFGEFYNGDFNLNFGLEYRFRKSSSMFAFGMELMYSRAKYELSDSELEPLGEEVVTSSISPVGNLYLFVDNVAFYFTGGLSFKSYEPKKSSNYENLDLDYKDSVSLLMGGGIEIDTGSPFVIGAGALMGIGATDVEFSYDHDSYEEDLLDYTMNLFLTLSYRLDLVKK